MSTENQSGAKHLKIVKLAGGLGNQMFQYAFGITIPNVLWDISSFDINHYRAFDLNLYNIDRNFATLEQTKKCMNELKFKNPLPRSLRKKFNMSRFIYLKTNAAREKRINKYQPDIFVDNVYYDGFFQTEKYFKPFREKILHDFKLMQPLDQQNLEILDKIRHSNSVALHVRRGDYLNPKVPLVLLDVDYYYRAIDYIANHVDNPHFFIFSNDLEWVKENIKTSFPMTFVDINDEKHGYFDLELMRNCKHNIIANSSFSWWGAWLNTYDHKIVIAPSQWFKPNADECSDDVVSDDWIKL